MKKMRFEVSAECSESFAIARTDVRGKTFPELPSENLKHQVLSYE